MPKAMDLRLAHHCLPATKPKRDKNGRAQDGWEPWVITIQTCGWLFSAGNCVKRH